MEENTSIRTEESHSAENSLSIIIQRFFIHWRWFLLCIFLSVCGGFLYLRYQAPLFEVNSTVLIKDDKKGGGLSELSAFEDLGLLKKTNNIDNEIEILKSRALMTLVVRELRLNVSYLSNSGPIEKEQFTDAPIYLRFPDGDSTVFGLETELSIIPFSETEFHLFDGKGKALTNNKFGDVFNYAGHKMSIIPQRDLVKSKDINKEVRIRIAPLDKVVDDYRKIIKIDPVNKTSNVIAITLRDRVKEKAAAVVDNLIQQHNEDAISDKNQVSRNTADFINERIRFITEELSIVEGEAEDFKTRHKLVDVESEAKLFLQTGTSGEAEILEASTQKALADYMAEYIKNHTAIADLIPANLGLNDNSVSAMILEYNKIVLERNRILRNSSEKNPVVENLTDQLTGIRRSINESLINYQTALNIKIRELNRQETGINSKIATVPKYEREYRIIQRQQQIKETLYLYLLQKREETNIALAVTVANAKIIDKAYGSVEPVSPKRKIVMLLALFAGTALFIVIVYISDLLDNKVHGKRDISKTGVPFLGDIPRSESKAKLVVSRGDNSSIAEAFRLLRTNVDFIMADKKAAGRTIFLTSTLGKEGKSFVALNLASSIAISGKKVLVIGMDVRAPKLLEYLEIENDNIGLTNYISDPQILLSQIILKAPVVENMDILPSGAIPPNPAELLMSDRVKFMFEQVRADYDYIIVDTAPVGMVTDTLLLSRYADAFIFVVRAYYLDKRLLSVAQDLYKEKRLPNMAILINGTDKEKGYGYGYGYGYGGYGYGHEKPRPWWKRMFGIK